MRVVSDERVGRVVPQLIGVVAVVAVLVLLVVLRCRLAETVVTDVSRRLLVRASPMAVVVAVVAETRVRQAPRRSSEVVVALEVVALVRSRPGTHRLRCALLEMERAALQTPAVAVVEAVTAPRT